MKIIIFTILLLIPLHGFCDPACLKNVKKRADRLTLDSCVGLKLKAIQDCRKELDEYGAETNDEDFLENCQILKAEALKKCRKSMYAKLAASSCGGRTPKAPASEIERYADSRDNELDAKRRTAEAFGNLSTLRSAIQVYFGDHEGYYPPALETLAPAYIKAETLEIHLPGRAPTSKAVNVKSFKGSDICSIVKNTGGWLYVADKNSPKFGDVAIDSSAILRGKPACEW